MTYMTEAPRPEHPVAHGDPTGAFAQTPRRLRNVGGRPVVFHGEELAMAMSYTPELPYWFEINLYRASDGSFPIAIKQFFQSEDQKDIARAWIVPSLDAAMAVVEQYDPAHDVPVPGGLMGAALSAAEMEAMALDLKAQVDHARVHYASLAGEFLHALDA